MQIAQNPQLENVFSQRFGGRLVLKVFTITCLVVAFSTGTLNYLFATRGGSL
jgi:hypothetical protein